MRHLISLTALCVLVGHPVAAFAAGGQNVISGFRYQVCEGQRCIRVEAPKAWVSVANGSFATDGAATLSIFKEGKLEATYEGTEAVSQPVLDALTFQTSQAVLFVHLSEMRVETISKTPLEQP